MVPAEINVISLPSQPLEQQHSNSHTTMVRGIAVLKTLLTYTLYFNLTREIKLFPNFLDLIQMDLEKRL